MTMAAAFLFNGAEVDVTPDNWQELAYTDRQLRTKAFGRPLTLDEASAVISAWRAKGLSAPLPDYRKGIDQAADSVSYGREAEKLIQNPSRIPTALRDLLSVNVPDVPGFAFGSPSSNLAMLAGVAVGAYVIWRVFK
jgi:hypothetical protein